MFSKTFTLVSLITVSAIVSLATVLLMENGNKKSNYNYVSIGESSKPEFRNQLVTKLNDNCPRLQFMEIEVSTDNKNYRNSVKVDGVGSNEIAIIMGQPVIRDGYLSYNDLNMNAPTCLFVQKKQVIGFYAAGIPYTNSTNHPVLAIADKNSEDLTIVKPNEVFSSKTDMRILELSF